jgi:hypothetical protein
VGGWLGRREVVCEVSWERGIGCETANCPVAHFYHCYRIALLLPLPCTPPCRACRSVRGAGRRGSRAGSSRCRQTQVRARTGALGKASFVKPATAFTRPGALHIALLASEARPATPATTATSRVLCTRIPRISHTQLARPISHWTAEVLPGEYSNEECPQFEFTGEYLKLDARPPSTSEGACIARLRPAAPCSAQLWDWRLAKQRETQNVLHAKAGRQSVWLRLAVWPTYHPLTHPPVHHPIDCFSCAAVALLAGWLQRRCRAQVLCPGATQICTHGLARRRSAESRGT